MFFPELVGKQYGYVNLNREARRWFARHNISTTDANPLLDPSTCAQMVAEFHRRRGLDFSYGGWMEDRSDLWRGTYLEPLGTFMHLGVDINVPAGTLVAPAWNAEVLEVGTDYPEEHGWGTYAVMLPEGARHVVTAAHLDPNIGCKVGDRLRRGECFAHIGTSPTNGGWFAHGHFQCCALEHYETELDHGRVDVDGYGDRRNRERLAQIFVNPVPDYIRFS